VGKQRKTSARKAAAAAAAPAPLAPPKPVPTWRLLLVRWGPIPALVLIMAAAVALRIIPSQHLVFPHPGEVRLFDTDPYYHLRHARYAAKHFPHLQRMDPALYPGGQSAIYAGLFDLAIAGAADVLGAGHPTEYTIERTAAWTPAALGALAFVAMFWLGWACSGPGAGLLAALMLLLVPGSFIHRSLVGSVDHHVAEALLALATFAGVTRCLQTTAADDPVRPWWRPAALHALPLALFLFTWEGAPIYVVVVGVMFFVTATFALARGDGPTVARATVRYVLGVAAVVVPLALLFPWLIMEHPLFYEALLAVGLIGAGVSLYVAAVRFASRRGLGPRWATVGGAILVVLGAILFVRLFPGGRGLLGELIGVKTDLVREQADVTWRVYWRLGGPLAVAAGLAPIIAVVDAARGRDPRFRLAPIIGATLVVALWIRTHDYGYVGGPMVVFLGTMVVVRLFEVVRGRWQRIGLALAGATALVVPIAINSVARPLLPASATSGLMLLTDGWVQTLGWMRAHTPPLVLPLDATLPADRPFHHPKGNYGVLAFWDFGHYIADLGERPPLASGGISGSIAHWFLLTDEDAALKDLRSRVQPDDQVRYVIADARTEGDLVLAALQMVGYDKADYMQAFNPSEGGQGLPPLWTYTQRFYDSIGSRLYDRNGDGLGHFRMVYASREPIES
jgi:dolichyl-diphosphooligosaccharide--protein glycosyltransferase